MNKKDKNRIVGIFILIILLLVASWTYVQHLQKDAHTLTIGIYTDSSWGVPKGNQYDVIDYAIKEFHQQHPNIKVQYESGIRQEDYQNWLSAKIVKGQAPDVMIVPEKKFNLLASLGAFKKLDSFMKMDHLGTHTFYKSTLAAGQYDDCQYALPYETNPTFMIANHTLLKKHHFEISNNWTPNEFQQYCHKIRTQKNRYGVSSAYTWQDAMLAYNYDPFSGPNHQLDITSNRARKGFSLIENLYNYDQAHDHNTQAFDRGQVAFLPVTLAQYRTYTSYPFHVTRNDNFKWQVLKMPGIKNAKATPASTVCFAISKKSSNVTAAWDFIKMMCSNPKIQQRIMKVHKGCSVIPSVVKSKQTANLLRHENYGKKGLSNQLLNKIVANEATNPKFKNYSDQINHVDYQINQAISYGNLDTQLFNIQMQINKNEN